MAFPPHVFSDTDGSSNSDWEVHKLAALGLGRLGSYASALAALLLAVTYLPLGPGPGFVDRLKAQLGEEDRLRELLEGFSTNASTAFSMASARWALVGCIALGVGMVVIANIKKHELHHPISVAVGATWGLSALGAFATANTGGLGGALALGMVPYLWTWSWTMPRGNQRAWGAVGVGTLIHLGVVFGLTGWRMDSAAVGGLLAVLLSVAASMVAGQTIESWRVKASEVSQTDGLTGALSRKALEERLGALCAQRQRSLAPLALIMFDIDRFRSVNDKHGRGAGDELLEMLVSGIKAEIRASDFLGRYGGDEFLLVLDECEGASAVSLLERLRERFSSKPMAVKDAQVRVSFSAGVVSVSTGDPLELKDLLRSAERALEASKEAGRNRTSVAPPPPPGSSMVVSAEHISEVEPDEEATMAVEDAPGAGKGNGRS